MRWIFRALSLVLLLALAAGGALLLVPSEKIARIAESQFEAATGRKMTLSGAVHATLWPRLGVRTGAVAIANADWAKDGPLLSAKGLEIGIDPGALLGGEIRVSKVKLLAPRILLVRGKDGRGNWEFSTPATAADDQAATATPGAQNAPRLTAFSLDAGEISEGTLEWRDRASGQALTLSHIEATLKIPSFTGPASLRLNAKSNGAPLSLRGTLGSFAAALSGQSVASELNVQSGDSQVAFKGDLGLSPLALKGDVTADLKHPAALAALLGQKLPDLPLGLGHDAISAKGEVTLTQEGALRLRAGEVALDQNRMQLSGALSLAGKKPRLSAQITAGALDLSALSAAGGGRASDTSDAPAQAGWSHAPIDASALHDLDATITLSAPSIDLGTVRLGRTQAQITIDNGRAVADLQQVTAYDGSVTGQLVANARGGLSVAANLVAKGVSMRPLLSDLAGYDRLDSSADLSVKLLASGNSQSALAHSLSGTGSVSLGKGALQGLDLLGMLRTLDLNYMGTGAKTIFDTITASFTIAKGVLRNDDLALEAPLLSVAGKGTVNIGAQTLDYTLTPTALRATDGTGGVQVPLTITGAWSKPKFGLDMEALTGKKVDAAKKDLETRAKTEVAKKLGITQDEGQSVEDAARKKLEDEARKGLLKLFK